jgi:transposase-like protein
MGRAARPQAKFAMSESTKVCTKCGSRKPLESFGLDRRKSDGHRPQCKACANECARRRYAANPGRARERARLWYAANPERARKSGRAWREKNAEYVRAAGREYAERHQEYRRAKSALDWAVRSGSLSRGPCELCGSTEYVDAHHGDYARPLDVRWLCRSCHQRLHAAERNQREAS